MFVRVLSFLCLFFGVALCDAALAQSPPLVPFPPTPDVKIAVNAATNKVYVVNEFDNTVTAYDESAGTSTTIPVGPRPQFIAVNPVTNRVYVDNAGDATLTVIDGATDTNLTPTALNMGSQGPIAVNAATNVIYIVRMSDPGRDEVTFLNGVTNEWYTIATNSFQPTALALNPATNTIYVAHYATGDVRVISGAYDANNDFPATVSIGSWTHPFAIAANPVTNKVYVLTQDARGPIGIINGANNAADFPLPATGHAQDPRAIAVNPVTNKVYAVFANEVVVIDGTTNAYTYVPIGTTGAGPTSIAVNPATNMVYVATNNGAFVVIDGATNATTTIAIPSGAVTMALNPITNKAYVFGDALTRVDIDAATASSVPLTTAITPLGGDTSDPNPTFTLSASSGFAPNAPAISNVYVQLDSKAGAWTQASGAGPYTATFHDLPPGAHTLFAFAADTQFPSTSTGPQSLAIPGRIASYNFTVTGASRAVPTLSLATSRNPATAGQAVTFTATISGSAVAPTGSIAFQDGASPISGCESVAIASGSATCATSSLIAGNHSITAHYAGDNAYQSATSGAIAQAIVKVATTTALSSSSNPSHAGDGLTFTVSVAGAGGTPSGAVTVNEGTNPVTGCMDLNLANGTASCSTSTLASGTHTLTATYAGDTTFNASTSAALTQSVDSVKVNATIAIASSANPSVTGQPVTFTATISGSAGAPAGSVAFTDNGSSLCSAVGVAAGSAQCTTSGLIAGTHSINATYSGDSAYNGGTRTLSQVVNAPKANPSVTLSSSANPAVSGQAITLTVVVGGSNGVASGSVSIADAGAVIASCASMTLASGSATCSVNGFEVGTHTLTASYAGDGAYNAATSTAFSQSVNAQAAASVAVSSSANPAAFGARITFSANVTGNAGTPSGFVDFLDGTQAIGNCGGTAVVSGVASCTTSSLAAGDHDITAHYSGDSTYPITTSSALRQTVQQPRATAALSLSATSIDFGGQSMDTTSTPRSLVITNTGGTALTISSIALNGDAFAGSNDCATLAPGASCTVTLTFTPPAAAAPLNGTVAVQGSLSIASNAASSPETVALSGTAEKSLVTHYYRSILRRDPDADGKAFWQNEAARVAQLGADVNEAWYALAMAFYASPEYQAFKRDDAGFIEDLYETFFNRAPDADGFAYWQDQMRQGLPRDTVLAAFMFSPEFAAFTQGVFGDTSVRAEVNLAMDFYRGALSRLPDTDGFNHYVAVLRNAQCQGADAVRATASDMSNAFFASPEYGARQRTDAQFVSDLYNTILRRGGDLDGATHWIAQLGSGAISRDALRAQFVASPEFSNRVENVVAQGCRS